MKKNLLVLGLFVLVVALSAWQVYAAYTPRNFVSTYSAELESTEETIAPTAELISLNCINASNCALTLDETGAYHGQIVTMINISANRCTMTESAGVQELGTVKNLDQADSISFIYDASFSSWVCTGNKDN